MSNQFDDDFAPLRKAAKDAGSNMIIKDSRIDSDQIMRIKKIPLFNSRRSGKITMSSNRSGRKSVNSELSTVCSPQNTAVGDQRSIIKEKDAVKSTSSKLNFTPAEEIIIAMVIAELQDKIYPKIGESDSEVRSLGVMTPSGFFFSHGELNKTLHQYMERYSSLTPLKSCTINLIEPHWKYIHAGYHGAQRAIEQLKDTNPHISFIVIDSQDQTSSAIQFVVPQIMSQLYRVDPTFIDIIRKTNTASGLEKHIIDLVQYSDNIETLEKKLEIPKRTFLLFIDVYDRLASFHHQIIDELIERSLIMPTAYIKLSDTHQDGYKNINFRSTTIREKEYHNVVITNLLIFPNDSTNQFVDLFNDMVTHDSTHTSLREYISYEIKSCYQCNMNPIDCSQKIIRAVISQHGK